MWADPLIFSSHIAGREEIRLFMAFERAEGIEVVHPIGYLLAF